jgi:xanthine dehydrogenase YagS FAD-binding subunit
MRPISYARATEVDEAVATALADGDSVFLAGGTTAIDLLRLNVMQPSTLIDINRLPLDHVSDLPNGGVRIEALSRMSDVAQAHSVRERFPVIAQALVLGASPQIRNMASMGGNLMQRVRCAYFRDAVSPCNKRQPGSGCSALHGINRGHAILGVSEHCIATHPSDVAVALVALDAVVRMHGPNGDRAIPIDDFFLLPGATPEREHLLEHGELIVAIDVPGASVARTSLYLKVRDRESYEFALVSVAVAMRVHDGTITDVRLALGGVGTKPWRARRAEEQLVDAPAERESFVRAAREELSAATPREFNTFKVELAQRAIVRALESAMLLEGELA